MNIKNLAICSLTIITILISFSNAQAQDNVAIVFMGESQDSVKPLLENDLMKILPDSKVEFVDFNHPQAQQFVQQYSLRYLPFVVLSDNVTNNPNFMTLVKEGIIEKAGNLFFISPQRLKSYGFYLIGSKRDPDKLELFTMSLEPRGQQALRELINLIKNENQEIRIMKPAILFVLFTVLLCCGGSALATEVVVQPLSLQEALQLAKTSNYQVLVARSQFEEAGGRNLESWQAFVPRLDVGGSFARSNDPVFVFGTKLKQGVFTMEDFALDASLGSHFFHNVTSMDVGYFSVNHTSLADRINWEVLKKQKVVKETNYFKHVRFDHPVEIMKDGKQRKSVITWKAPKKEK